MARFIPTLLISLFLLIPVESRAQSLDYPGESRVSAIVQKMESSYQTVKDYSCEVEQVFYKDGVEDQRYRFKFYFKRGKKIRVDFAHPYSSLTIFYHEGDKDATVMPLRFLPALRFRFSINSPKIKTIAGQRVDQTDMGYFIQFLSKNLKTIEQKKDEYREDEEQVKFLFWATDYIDHKHSEKYRISVSKKIWLPLRIERYNLEDRLIETTDIKNYVINGHLEDNFFQP
ncbi:MAG: outer membrane lipoprotein carrier protein LolA [Thermodesulfobacteriota bacterium]